MLQGKLEEIDEAMLQSLCAEQCPESETLEFKRELPEPGDKGRVPFLKEICGLANAEGGDLVFGVNEHEGRAANIAPIAGPSFDEVWRRLAQLVSTGIEPTLVGVRFREVPVTGGYALLVRVPASFDGPHRLLVNADHSRFVMRNGTHTETMSYEQVRTAFDRTATLAERARGFRTARLEKLEGRFPPLRMIEGPLCAFHFIPIAGMSGRQTVDVADLYNNYSDLVFDRWGGATRTLNLDGLVIYPGAAPGMDGILAVSRIFRSGAMEAVRSAKALGGDPKDLVLPSHMIAKYFREATQRFLSKARKVAIVGPAVIGGALLSIQGYRFSSNNVVADRPRLVLPELWIENVASTVAIDEQLRPMLDLLWQCFDAERCELYAADGTWNPDSKWEGC